MPKKPQPLTFNIIWPACIQCGACVAVCLQPEPFTSPFDTIAVDAPCQIACLHCVEICPTSAITYRIFDPAPDRLSSSDDVIIPLSVQAGDQELNST